MTPRRFFRIGQALCRLIGVVVFTLGAVASPEAQTAGTDLFTYFYKDPRPERLISYLADTEHRPEFRNWQAYPPLAGFFAVIFAADPTLIDKLVPQQLNPMLVETLAAALQLSGNGPRAEALPKPGGARDDTLRAEFANLPARLEDLEIATPTHLDILWGASFAGGNSRYARMILDFFADTANRSEAIAVDVAKVTLAMMGGPDDVLATLRDKYGDALTTEIVYAAGALGGVQSNAHHDFIDAVAVAYVQENPDTSASKAISALRKPR